MKRIALILITISSVFHLNSQTFKEKEIKSNVNSATVFLNSAQISRDKKIPLEKGIQI
jgi:hypothetical protein